MPNAKDISAGLLFVAAGGFYGAMTLRSLEIGSALNMGPGYFPICLAAALVGIGLITIVQGFATVPREPFGVVPWRAVICISLSIIFFALFVRRIGMLPGAFGASLFACLAGRNVNLLMAAVTSVAIAVFCTIVFVLGVGLNIPIIGPIFGMWQ